MFRPLATSQFRIRHSCVYEQRTVMRFRRIAWGVHPIRNPCGWSRIATGWSQRRTRGAGRSCLPLATGRNTKSQTPSSRETPSSKSQMPPRCQCIRAWDLEEACRLQSRALKARLMAHGMRSFVGTNRSGAFLGRCPGVAPGWYDTAPLALEPWSSETCCSQVKFCVRFQNQPIMI